MGIDAHARGRNSRRSSRTGRRARTEQGVLSALHAATSVGARQGGGVARRTHRDGVGREPVDHRGGGARRRAVLARAQLRDRHRCRHGARRRSATERARLRVSRVDGVIRQPLRVVVDSSLRTPPNARVFQAPGEALVAAVARTYRSSRLVDAGAEVFETGGPRVDLAALLGALAARGANEVLVEAGATLTGEVLRLGVVGRSDRLSRAEAARPRRSPLCGTVRGAAGRFDRRHHRRRSPRLGAIFVCRFCASPHSA